MRKNKIPIKKVHIAFSNAIKRRDCRCMIRDYEPCYGQLECSHFFTQGGNPSLMFYPLNAYVQCSRHHYNHHNKTARIYIEWMQNNHQADLDKMAIMRNKYIKYTDELKAEIIRLCNADRLDELTDLIEKELLK